MLRKDLLAVQILEDGRGKVHVPLDSGGDPIGNLQGLELVEAEFTPLAFLADNVPEEEPLLRVLLANVPGPLRVGIEEPHVQNLLFDGSFFGGVERRESCSDCLW